MAGGVTSNSVRALAVLVAVWLALAAAVAVGSWQHAKGPENERPQERGTAAGLTTYGVPSAGFTIAVPESWQAFTADEVFADSEALDRLTRENPELAQFRDALADPRSPIKLIAADPDVRSGFAANVNVIAQKVPDGYSFEDFARANEAEIRSIAGGAGDLKREIVELPVGRAQRLAYHTQFTMNGQDRSFAMLQYGLVANGRSYILTYTTLREFADEYENDFERSARSFGLG
jgi:hypothetical protein